MNDYEKISRRLVWINGLLAIFLVANVAFAVRNFSDGRMALGGISAGSALLAVIALVKS